jgi:HlyD family secretion protein
MTAMATIVIATKQDVLLVPNAALRFTPKDAGRKPGQPMPEERHGERRVWVLHAGKPKAVSLRIGASDGRMTEVGGGDLQPGMQVIVGVEED